MRLRLVRSACRLCSLWILPLQAQPRPADSATHEMIGEALQGHGVLYLRQQDTYNFTLKNHQVTFIRLDNGGRVLIQEEIKKKVSLELLNRYNEQLAVTTRGVRYQKQGVVLEAGLDCQLGVTSAVLQEIPDAGFGNDLKSVSDLPRQARRQRRQGPEDRSEEGAATAQAGLGRQRVHHHLPNQRAAGRSGDRVENRLGHGDRQTGD